MKNQWREVILPVPADQMETVCNRLTANGMSEFVVEEENEFLQFLMENRQYWGYVDDTLMERMKGISQIKFYVPDDRDGDRRMREYLSGLEQYEPKTILLQEEDWAVCWQKYYQPISIGSRFQIIPEWMRDTQIPQGRIPIYLNPGLTFGTGSHASTQLCMELMEDAVRPEDKILDLGCGSGILAIASLKMGAQRVIGVDIDPNAVDVAHENAEINGIAKDRLTVYAGDILQDTELIQELDPGHNQVILANIVADVIIPLTCKARGLLSDRGIFICSGIIDTRADEVAAVMEKNGMSVEKCVGRAGWCAFRARLCG